jgi:hypothetical protein
MSLPAKGIAKGGREGEVVEEERVWKRGPSQGTEAWQNQPRTRPPGPRRLWKTPGPESGRGGEITPRPQSLLSPSSFYYHSVITP